MGDWISGLWEHLTTPEGGEIRRHGIIGGIVAALLALSEAFGTNIHQIKYKLVLIFCVFVVGFFVIFVSEYWFDRKKPVSLLGVGVVDGHWLYGVSDADRAGQPLIRGSIVKITSSGTGFRVQGTAYLREHLERSAVADHAQRLGAFEGKGSKGSSATLYFYYEGYEFGRGDREHSGTGVGYYKFWMDDDKFESRGFFTGTGLDKGGGVVSSREVFGYKIDDTSLAFDGKEERALLLKYLQSSDDRPDHSKIDFPNAGVVDGWWVDAVYEGAGGDWELVEGSVLMIETDAASNGFSVKGDTYLANQVMGADDPTQVTAPYDFSGAGQAMKTGEGCYYEYSGTSGRIAAGTGYYLFHRKRGEAPTFDGAFLSVPGEPYRIVVGKKIEDSDVLDLKEQRIQLRKHLEECQARSPAVIHAANSMRRLRYRAASKDAG
ncbi:MAG: hypothetical protein ABI383_09595 [Acidobacteriaceae bacterium]